MSSNTQATAHLAGETTGTAERPAQRLAGAVRTFDLAREVAQLREGPGMHRRAPTGE
jgi:hypothetical protein